MKIVIEHGKTKRMIDGPFNICGSREDLMQIVDEIVQKVTDSGMTYGWVAIRGPAQRVFTNTVPDKWD